MPRILTPNGTQLWLFIDDGVEEGDDMGLKTISMGIASSTDPSWQVSDLTVLSASDANIFAYQRGIHHPEGIILVKPPIPEPGTLYLTFIGAVGFIFFAWKRTNNSSIAC